MQRVIAHGLQAREELAKGADYLAECVKSTLGPFGQNFFLDKKNTITNDGVTVAREVHLSSGVIMPDGKKANEFNNRGATALREAAIKTVEEVGDGTTTAVILAQAIYKECSRFLPSDVTMGKKSAAEVIRQVEKERKEVTEKLIAKAEPIDTEEKLVNSATVSVGDKELGELIGKAQWKLGKEGRILAEETAKKESYVEYSRGILIDNGFGTSLLVNNQEKQILEVENCGVILTSYTMKGIKEWDALFKGVLKQLFNAGRNDVVIIARAWTDETINYCLQNINKGALKIYPISAPYMNMAQKMKDLEALTGAKYYDSESSRLDDINISDVGFAEKVVARRMDGIITGKETSERIAQVENRIKELTDEMTGSPSDFDKKHLAERIAQLKGGFATLKVGSHSDMERRRLFDKCDDAVHAVRAAFAEGVVRGGGIAFKEIAETLPDDYILKRPLLTVYQQIMASAPKDFVIEDWVKDPVKVLRIALENACVAASSFATAGGVITERKPSQLEEMFGKQISQNQNTGNE